MKFDLLAAAVVLGLVGVTTVGAAASANTTVIYGMDQFGNAVGVPSALCVAPGQEIRLTGDVVDFSGRRGYLPAEAFTWRLTRSSGFWEQWDAGMTTGYGPFRRGFDVMNSVYVRVPFDLGPNGGRLEAMGRGAMVTRIQLVDADSPFPASCQWGPASIYVGGPVPIPAPTPIPTPTPEPTPVPSTEPSPVPPSLVYPCYGSCTVDAICSDGCPPGALCNYIPGGVPYWRVIRCPR